MKKSQKSPKPSLIMGVVNITPDSFSDGGLFLRPETALDQALRLVDEGADIIDFGAESSRPGAKLITEAEEWRRLEPLLELLARRELGARISIDTNKPTIMARVIDYGVGIINDIKGGADDPTLRKLAESNFTYIAMHMHREPELMQEQPLAADKVVEHVEQFFSTAHERLKQAGFADEAIWLDPGIGFGKTDGANLKLLQYSIKAASSYNLIIGLSRKSFIGRFLGISEPRDRDGPSKMLELGLILAGVRIIRTHDVQTLNKMRLLLS